MYYRALAISAGRALELLEQLAAHPQLHVFEADEVLSRLHEQYQSYKQDAEGRLAALQARHPEVSQQRIRILEQDILQGQEQALDELESGEVISPGVKSALYTELQKE